MTCAVKWKRVRVRRACRWLAVFGVLCIACFVVAWFAFPFSLERLRDYPVSERTLDRDGNLLRVYVGPTGEIRFPVAAADISPWLVKATVAVEDERFFWHPGVDPVAICRAILQNVAAFEIRSGASTITMQLVRMVNPRPRTLPSKMIEAFHALQVTTWTSKEETLVAYLNLTPYGGNLRGVEAASLRYYGKRAKHLDPRRGGAPRGSTPVTVAVVARPALQAGSRQTRRCSQRDAPERYHHGSAVRGGIGREARGAAPSVAVDRASLQ